MSDFVQYKPGDTGTQAHRHTHTARERFMHPSRSVVEKPGWASAGGLSLLAPRPNRLCSERRLNGHGCIPWGPGSNFSNMKHWTPCPALRSARALVSFDEPDDEFPSRGCGSTMTLPPKRDGPTVCFRSLPPLIWMRIEDDESSFRVAKSNRTPWRRRNEWRLPAAASDWWMLLRTASWPPESSLGILGSRHR